MRPFAAKGRARFAGFALVGLILTACKGGGGDPEAKSAAADPPEEERPVTLAASDPEAKELMASAAPEASGTSIVAPAAPSDAGAAAPTTPELTLGEGRCQRDSDCVVASTLDPRVSGSHACCSYVCPPGRVVSRALESGIEARHAGACATPPLCPPPAPCPKTDRVLKARCITHRCVGEVTAK